MGENKEKNEKSFGGDERIRGKNADRENDLSK